MLKFTHKSVARACLCFSLLFASAHARPAHAQTAAADQPSHSAREIKRASKPDATFDAESRLVVLDVVVTDRHRRPATGLVKSDFTLLEDGKPQVISIFEDHVPLQMASQPLKPSAAPYQFSNFSAQSPSAINIVLFDTLNTPLLDQPNARAQMVQFLKTLPRGEPLALFELGNQLRMIAGFGTRSEDLIAAAKKIVPHPSEMLDTQEERQEAEAELAVMRAGSRNQAFFDRMHDFMVETEGARDENRAAATLNALTALAHAVSGFRGRKNLLWLSEELPIYFGPDLNPQQSNPDVRSFSDIMRDTAAELSSAQMSIYPIDVRGLSVGLANANARSSTGISEIQSIETIHDEMDELARETGGRAFYDTNDLRWAMQRSLENGSHYYTLAYVPRDRRADSKYHRIRVQLKKPGLQAEYRKGYFAAPEKPTSEADAFNTLLSATQPATPESTMLQLKARIVLPDLQHPRVGIHFHLDGSDLTFSDAPEGRKNGRLQVIALAWDANLKTQANSSHFLELSLPPDKYDYVVHNGIAAYDELDLKPGTYTVCLGVMDEASKKIGTLQMPIEIAQPKKASATQNGTN